MPVWIQTEVVQKKIWAEGLFTLSVRSDGVESFQPGQFLHLALPEEGAYKEPLEDSNRVNRPYSVASPFGKTLEFFIVLVKDGQLTPKLWDLEVGDHLEVSQGASGRFTLEQAPKSENLWLVATGTGLAPYIAMLRTETPWSTYQNVIVVHGARHHSDLAYTEELQSYKLQYPGRFHLVQTLTRERVPGLLHGRIPRLFDNRDIEEEVGIDCWGTSSTVLLCGNPAMLDAMETMLKQRDMNRHRSKSPGQIVVERYW